MVAVARLARALRNDLGAFARHVGRAGGAAEDAPPPGLHTYRFGTGGERRRLHLRMQADGSGLLFVDVMDVVNLSETAAHMAYLCLEDAGEQRALSVLARRFRGVSRRQLRSDYRRVAGAIRELSAPGSHCHTCAADLPRTPLFSTRAQAPHKVDLAITYACNNDCPHCYNDPSRFDLQSLSGRDWKQVLDRLAEVATPRLRDRATPVTRGRLRSIPPPGVSRSRRAGQLSPGWGLSRECPPSPATRLATPFVTASASEPVTGWQGTGAYPRYAPRRGSHPWAGNFNGYIAVRS